MKVAFDEIRRQASRALSAAGVAPGLEEECGWACAWLQAAGYDGVKMLVEALETTPRENRRPSLAMEYGIVNLDNGSCVFAAPQVVDVAASEGRVFLANVRHGLYVLPFAVRANLAIGCPVDPSFAVGGERKADPYAEKIRAAVDAGIEVADADWSALLARAKEALVPETAESLLRGAGAGTVIEAD
ncbi:MAG: DUF3726 domain-containing protein [Hyphomicrobiales bacterium]